MNEAEWLGKDNQLGMDIWNNKYCSNGETFDHWIDRVSGHDTEAAKLIREKKFLFGGRILANRGLEYEGKKLPYPTVMLLRRRKTILKAFLTGQAN